MIFRLPTRIEPMNEPPFATCDPERIAFYAAKGVKTKQGMLRIPRLSLVIRGEYETKKKAEVILLIKTGGALRFDCQEAVDEGILTVEEVEALGYSAEAPTVPVEPKVEEPEPPSVMEKLDEEVDSIPDPMPDFDTMSKAALVKWALNQDPPINLDGRKRKDNLVAELQLELATRKE